METFRTYTANDMAKIYCEKCNGCGDCCHGMTDTIHLDPYDVEQLRRNLGKSFEEMLQQREIGLHVEQGMILPHLQFRDMTDHSHSDNSHSDGNNICPFLGQDNRCRIHAFRPGFCRLFPLGRDYDASTRTFRYFVVDAGCDMPGKMKMKISKWLGVPQLPRYEKFVADWHYFCKDVEAKLLSSAAANKAGSTDSSSANRAGSTNSSSANRAGSTDSTVAANRTGSTNSTAYASALNRFLLTVFYQTPYPPDKDFYELFYIRLHRAREVL